MSKGKWTVQTRYGWGWSVYDPDGMPGKIEPVDSYDAAQAYCKARNAGKDHREAWAALKEAGGSTRAGL